MQHTVEMFTAPCNLSLAAVHRAALGKWKWVLKTRPGG
jgi:hypothetical protein